MKPFIVLGIVASSLLGAMPIVQAQSYPSRPIRFIVP
jgi:hypothetical protein